ncbi:MAG: HlyD family efflux transporter periplasmic adaptor subunit [Isosphaeraceae bacterium]
MALIGLGVAALAAAGLVVRPRAGGGRRRPGRARSLVVTVDHEGKTRVKERYVVSSPLAGRLLRVQLRAGDRVNGPKTLLAVIEPVDPALLDVRARSEALARVDRAEAALKKAAADVERTKTLVTQARKVADRDRNLQARIEGAVSKEQFETDLFRERVALSEERSAEFALKVAEFELEQAQAALVHTRVGSTNGGSDSERSASAFRFEVPSPVEGVVLRVFQESTTVVTPGMKLVEVGDPTDLECEVDLLSTDAVKVVPGQRVILEQWGGERPLEGRVRVREPSGFTKVSALGVEEQRVNVIIDLTDPPSARPTLGDAYRVEARVVVWEGRDVLKIPAGAVFRREGKPTVFVIEDGRAVARAVETGHSNGLETEILSGLTPGDRVILHPGDRVAEGAAVKAR